jgi:hypothetical protein
VTEKNEEELRKEMKVHGLDTDGSLPELISRATRHEITLRKPADLCTAEECRGILKSREATIIKGEKLQTQVARLYALEDTPNYGPPRLKDLTGTSLFLHLFRAGLVVVCYCRVCFNISIDN